jgi:hypothetical protein
MAAQIGNPGEQQTESEIDNFIAGDIADSIATVPGQQF